MNLNDGRMNVVVALSMECAMNAQIVVVDVVEEKLILCCRDIGQATLSCSTPHFVEHLPIPVKPTITLLLHLLPHLVSQAQ